MFGLWSIPSCIQKISKLKQKSALKVPQSNLIAVVKFKYERMFFFCVFFNYFVTCREKSGIVSSILCGTLSHGDKHFFCLQLKDFLLIVLSHCKKKVYVAKNCTKCVKNYALLSFFCLFACPPPPFFCIFFWFLRIQFCHILAGC